MDITVIDKAKKLYHVTRIFCKVYVQKLQNIYIHVNCM